jgi:hypothetical protein
VIAAVQDTLPSVALLCLIAAAAAGLAKLANDAVIQERIDERVRASAFAHSETLLMISWVMGGAVGLIPFGGRWGLVVAAVFMVLGATKAVISAMKLRKERLTGTAAGAESTTEAVTEEATVANGASNGPSTGASSAGASSAAPEPSTATWSTRSSDATTEARRSFAPSRAPSDGREGPTRQMPAYPGGPGGSPPSTSTATPPAAAIPVKQRRFGWRKRRTVETPPTEPALDHPPTRRMPVEAPVSPAPDDRPMAPPGYTLYRPSGVDPTRRLVEDDDDHNR